MEKSQWLIGMAVGTLVTTSGCSAGSDERTRDEQATRVEQRVSGYLGDTPGCSDAEVEKLSDAILRVKMALYDPRTLQSLKEEVFEGPQHGYWPAPNAGVGYPEWVLARVGENIPTSIQCADSCAGSIGPGAPTCIDTESLCLPHVTIATDSAPDLADVIAHEVSHNKCLADYAPSPVPAATSWSYAVGEAVRRATAGESAGTWRSGFSQETTLAPVGLDYESAGTGLSALDSTCPGNLVGGGLWASFVSGKGPSSMALYCKPKDSEVGATYSPERGYRGPSGGLWSCGPGYVMVGLHGHADTQVRSIGALCGPRAAVLNKTSFGPIVKPHFGPDTGLEWRRQCPAGMVVKGFRERNDRADGSYPVTQLEVICQALSTPEPIALSEWDGPAFGTATRMFYVTRCLSRDVVTGLTSVSGSRTVTRLGGNCYGVAGSGSSATLNYSSLNGIGPFGDAYGQGELQSQLTSAIDDCPSGSALVGLSAYADVSTPLIRGIQGICAEFTTWNGQGATTITRLTARGATQEGPWSEYYCARGSYLSGWYIAEENGVTGVKGICRSF